MRSRGRASGSGSGSCSSPSWRSIRQAWGQGAALGIGQGLPGPAEDPRVVAGDLQGQTGESPLAGLVVPDEGLAGEQLLEAAPAPAVEGGRDALGQLGIRRKRVVEKLLQIPGQVLEQVAALPALHLDLVRGLEGDLGAELAVGEALDAEAVACGVADDQGVHRRVPVCDLTALLVQIDRIGGELPTDNRDQTIIQIPQVQLAGDTEPQLQAVITGAALVVGLGQRRQVMLDR